MSDNNAFSILGERLQSRDAIVAVIGLGYVGLPLSLAFAEREIEVIGLDVDPAKVEALNSGRSYLLHFSDERIAEVVRSGKLRATTAAADLSQADVILICVPTPLTPQRAPDLSYVEATAEMIASALRPGQLVILESTTYPRTTEEELRTWLERSGLEAGKDFLLAFSPEREDPGNESFRTTNIPKVVGGIDEASCDAACALYELIVPEVVRVSSARVAEATKLTENIFRAVNIALVNELKVIYTELGVDVREVLDAAATKPFGFMRFDPGPGWGGHCIPVDPFYLEWKAREIGRTARFIELAGEINVEMPRYVVSRLQRALNDRGKPVKGSRILLLGLAYKKDVADPRESPAFEILDLLLELGADVGYHDPLIEVAPGMRSWPELPPLRSQVLDRENLSAQDAVVVVTDHTSVDYEMVRASSKLIVDTRGVFRDGHENVVKA